MTLPLLLAFAVSLVAQFDRDDAGMEYSGISWIPKTDRYWVVDDKESCATELRVVFGGESAPTCSVVRTVTLEGRKDLEGCAFDPLTGDLWVSDEKDSSVRAFDLATGREKAKAELPAIYAKCRRNRSLEGLSISPDGHEMWVSNEEAIRGDDGFVRITRLVRPDGKSPWKEDKTVRYKPDPVVGEKFLGKYAYSGVSGLVALGNGRLLVLERECSVKSGGFFPSCRARLYQLGGDDGSKTLLWEANTELANYEGICLGAEIKKGYASLVLISDAGNSADAKIAVLSGVPLSSAQESANQSNNR